MKHLYKKTRFTNFKVPVYTTKPIHIIIWFCHDTSVLILSYLQFFWAKIELA